MSVTVKTSCPLGSKCEEIKDGELHRCAWFIELDGVNPNTGEEVKDRGCAMAWTPILLVENARLTNSTGAAVESFRNEMVQANERSVQMLAESAKIAGRLNHD